MSTSGITPVEFTLRLDEEERAQLLSCLEQVLRDALVEEHRTEAPDYREHVQRREAVLQRLLDKLRRP